MRRWPPISRAILGSVTFCTRLPAFTMALASGSPTRIARRAKNKILGHREDEAGVVGPLPHVVVDQRRLDARALALLDREHEVHRVVGAVDPDEERGVGTEQARDLRGGARARLLVRGGRGDTAEEDNANEVQVAAVAPAQFGEERVVLGPVRRPRVAAVPLDDGAVEELVGMHQRAER